MKRNIRELPMTQTQESYKRTLAVLRRRAELHFPLKYYDDTTPGMHGTECSLGLCDAAIEGIKDGVYCGKGQACPNDSRFFTVTGMPIDNKDKDTWGCFYTCHIFQGKSNQQETEIRILAATQEKL